MEVKTKLTIGGVPEHFNLPWQLGIESGAFKEIGVEVEYVDYPGGTGAMTKALRSNLLDVAIVLTEGCVADILNGNPSRVVKTYVESPLVWGVHIAGDSPIEAVDQIRGKRYAISRFGSGSHLMAIVDAAERGWPTEKMKFVVVENFAGARRALSDGEADVFFWERFTTSPLVTSGEFRRLDDRETPWPAFVVCVREQVIAEKRVPVSKLLHVVNQQCELLMKDSKSIELISKRYDLDVDQVRRWFRMTRWSTDFRPPRESLSEAISYLTKLGIVAGGDTVWSDIWVDLKL